MNNKKELDLEVLVSALEKCTDVLHEIINTPDTDEDNELIVHGVLKAIEDNFYLVPKYEVVHGTPLMKSAPIDAATMLLAEMWNTVSCGQHPMTPKNASETNVNNETFVGAVKAKRDKAVEYFMSEDFHQALANGIDEPEVVIKKGLDTLVGGVLDVVEERFEDIATIGEVAVDDELVNMVQIKNDLSIMYFNDVNS